MAPVKHDLRAVLFDFDGTLADSLADLDKLDGIEEPKSKYANFSLV